MLRLKAGAGFTGSAIELTVAGIMGSDIIRPEAVLLKCGALIINLLTWRFSVLVYRHTEENLIMVTWNDTQPIFIQIRQRIIDLILQGDVEKDEALPSVRQIAMQLSVNPLTVTKAYQSLLELEVIEKRRGLGMFLKPNARAKLLGHERDKFLNEEWPRIRAKIEILDLKVTDLVSKPKGKK